MLRPRFEELPSTIPFVPGGVTQPYPGTGLPRDLPYMGLILKLRYRNVVSAFAGQYFPEWPISLIRRIRVQGTKAGGGGSVTLVNIRGEEAAVLFRLFNQYIPADQPFNNVQPANAANTLQLITPAGVGGTNAPLAMSTVANGTFDGYAYYFVPFSPPRSLLRDALYGLQDFSIYSQVDLLLDFAPTVSPTSGISNSTAVNTITDFGLGAGAAQVQIHRIVALPGKGAPINKFHYIYSSKKIAIQAVIGATFADQKITDLNAGNQVRFIMLRQYAENANVDGLIDGPAGVSSARIADNSNIGTFRVRVKVNGNEKFRAFWPDLQEKNRADYQQDALMPQGYAVIDWSVLGPMSDIFDVRGYGAGAVRWELFGDGLNLVAADKMDVLQCEQVPVEV
jgi:hypothetical protein